MSDAIIHKPQPSDLAHVVLEVDQEIGEPRGVVPDVQPPDQRRPVGVGPLEELGRDGDGMKVGRLAERRDAVSR